MEFKARHVEVESHATGCLVLPVAEGRKQPEVTRELDSKMQDAVAQRLQAGDISGRLGETLLLMQPPGVPAERLLLVGIGREKRLDERRYEKIVQAAMLALAKTGARSAASLLTAMGVAQRSFYWKARQHAEIGLRGAYRFESLKSKPKTPAAHIKKVVLVAPAESVAADMKAGIAHAHAIDLGVTLARDLGNLPGNICTPTYLVERAEKLAGEHQQFKLKVLEEEEMQALGMHSLLSVARGSREPAKLIALRYQGGADKEKPVLLVGKGVTFDSGGISIKPGPAMDEMKFDMCGAASVLGCLRAVAALQLPLNVVGLVPATENLPDGKASKPGDIVKSLSGQSIEILNTDAEGRLILCDALTYGKRYEPEVVIDIATLTGACVIALGNHASGLMSNHDALADDLLAAGRASTDRAWRLPIWDVYAEDLKSNFADMANIGNRSAGAIVAGCFLAKFTGDYRWAHLDIAGTAWQSGRTKGATGRPVALLVQYLLSRAGIQPNA